MSNVKAFKLCKKETEEKDRKEKNKFTRENKNEITLYGEEEERERPWQDLSVWLCVEQILEVHLCLPSTTTVYTRV